MDESRGLTAEMYQAIVAIIDDRLREVRVTRQGFDQLTQAISSLTQAQARAEGRFGRLEEVIGRLAAASFLLQ